MGACSGGALFGGGVATQCHEVYDTPPTRPPTPPIHGDYARLRPYRTYVHLVSVGEARHHFVAWWQCIEPTYAEFTVTDQGDITAGRGGWGGIAVRSGDPPEVPSSVERLAENLHDHIARRVRDASNIQIAYRGYYREVLVEEFLPFVRSDDPERQIGTSTLVALHADASLTRLVRPPMMLHGSGYGLFCAMGSCRQEPHWLDVDPTAWSLALRPMTDAPDAPASRALADRLLAQVRDGRAVPLDALLARTESTPLPEAPQPPVHTGFTLYARPASQGATQPDTTLDVALSPDAIVRGGASGEAHTTWLGRTYSVQMSLALDGPLPPHDGWLHDVPMTLRYTITDGARTHTHAVPMSADLDREGDRAALLTWTLRQGPGPSPSPHEPPLGVRFDAPAGYTSIDGYVQSQGYITP